MTRKLRSFAALAAGATLLACCSLADAQTRSPPCIAAGTGATPTCGNTTPTPQTSGPASDPFPRTYLNFAGGNPALAVRGTTQAGVPFATVVAQYNLTTLGFYLGFEAVAGTTASALMRAWKAAASANGIHLRTLVYTPGSAMEMPGGHGWNWFSYALAESNMFAYEASADSGSTGLCAYGSGYLDNVYWNITTNNTQTAAARVNGFANPLKGYNVWDLYNRYFYDVYVNGLSASKYNDTAAAANPYLDGFEFDNANADLHYVPQNCTWLGVGTSPLGVTAQTTTATQQGWAKLMASMRSINPNFISFANGSIAAYPTVALDPSYVGVFNSLSAEKTIGDSYSVETFDNSPPGAFMKALIANEQLYNRSIGTMVLAQDGQPGGGKGWDTAQSSWPAAWWQGARMGFAATMQRNWHWGPNANDNYSSALLFDEQVQKGNYGWLSAGTQRLDPPQSAAWKNGVWRRRFPNGWVLWNPRGNGVQTVPIPSTLCRIQTRGYGDSTVNTGACGATSVTLKDGNIGDGLFLIGTG
jgi:hypothetical protein